MSSSTNHDPKEIARFDAIAQRWWDPHGEFRPLHALNPVRLDYVDNRAGLAGKRVLDVGCGGGLLSEAMARRGAQVTGIDLGPQTVEVAELHAIESKLPVSYARESAETHATRNAGAYDVVVCMEMLEHVPEPDSVLRALHALVKPGGHVIFETYLIDQAAIGHPKNPEYLLRHNELLASFDGFRVLFYREGKFADSKAAAFRTGIFAQRIQ